jgi:4-hydroxybenzoate polyprenyltransferase
MTAVAEAAATADLAQRSVPLCVELDDTLVSSGFMTEGVLRCIRQDLRFVVTAVGLALRGKTALKAELLRRCSDDPATLPFNQELLQWLKAEHARGRRLFLYSRGHGEVAQRVADHLAIFDGTVTGGSRRDGRGSPQGCALAAQFGPLGFDFVGSESTDTEIWKAARNSIVVTRAQRLPARLEALPRIEKQFVATRHTALTWVQALRLHQWSKNLLVFVPAVVSHRLFDPTVIRSTCLAFLCFGLCASATYIVNDLMDLDSDRTHARKRQRPFASGALSPSRGVLVAAGLLAVGLSVAALTLEPLFGVFLLIYVISTLWYSWALKRIAMVDVLALAGLYTLRVLAGSAAVAVEPSFWLLAFSMFMFLSLALVKRYTELRALVTAGRFVASGRGYTTDDLSLLLSCGTSAAYISVLVLALYVSQGTEQLYRHPKVLWLLCPLTLYWVSRVWRKAHRGELHDDPVVFALRDKPSLAVAFGCAALVASAI